MFWIICYELFELMTVTIFYILSLRLLIKMYIAKLYFKVTYFLSNE